MDLISDILTKSTQYSNRGLIELYVEKGLEAVESDDMTKDINWFLQELDAFCDITCTNPTVVPHFALRTCKE
jgi:hypothetical protein